MVMFLKRVKTHLSPSFQLLSIDILFASSSIPVLLVRLSELQL